MATHKNAAGGLRCSLIGRLIFAIAYPVTPVAHDISRRMTVFEPSVCCLTTS